MQSFFSTYLLPLSLSIIMMGMGLSLERRDFSSIIRYPKPVVTGIICQVFILPVVAFLLFGFTNLNPFVKVGFILITACAGGSATNVITLMLKGNLALSISLTAINSLIILITLPLIVHLGLVLFIGEERSIHLDVYNTVVNILLTIITPTLVGMLIRNYFFRFAIWAQKPLRFILPLILFSVFTVMIFFDDNGSQNNISDYLYIAPWALLLNFVSMLVVYLISKYLRLGGKNNFTISIEVGLKNSIVGIYVAESLLNNYDMAMVSVIYGSITFFSTLLFGYLAKRIELWGFGYRKLI
ncbi:bile acid:sodium symporter family protein [Bacteroidota bacterium]